MSGAAGGRETWRLQVAPQAVGPVQLDLFTLGRQYLAATGRPGPEEVALSFSSQDEAEQVAVLWRKKLGSRREPLRVWPVRVS